MVKKNKKIFFLECLLAVTKRILFSGGTACVGTSQLTGCSLFSIHRMSKAMGKAMANKALGFELWETCFSPHAADVSVSLLWSFFGSTWLIKIIFWNCRNSLFFDPFVNKIYDYTSGMMDLRSLKVILITLRWFMQLYLLFSLYFWKLNEYIFFILYWFVFSCKH